jgi:hypothetical protein
MYVGGSIISTQQLTERDRVGAKIDIRYQATIGQNWLLDKSGYWAKVLLTFSKKIPSRRISRNLYIK